MGAAVAGALSVLLATGGLAGSAAAAPVTESAALVSPAATGTPADQLVLSRVGTPGADLVSGASQVSLVTVNTDGSPSTTGRVDLPTAAAGADQPFTLSGTSDAQGSLSLSSSGNGLTLAGFGTTPDAFGSDPKGLSAAAAPRVVAWIDSEGNTDTSTVLGGRYDADNVRSSATVDGTTFYVAGKQGAESEKDGVVVASAGAQTATVVTNKDKNFRTVVIAGGQLYASSDKTDTVGVSKIGTGLPTGSVGTLSTPIATQTAAPGTPNGFALVDTNSDGAVDTAYVVVETVGILKSTLSGGSWTPNGLLTGAFESITARVGGQGVELYTLSHPSGDANSVLEITDSAVAGGAFAPSAATTIATAPAGTAYRGVAFAPTGWNPPANTGGENPATPTITPSSTGLALASGDATNPTLTVQVADADVADAGELAVTVSDNSNPAVSVNPTVSGTGATRTVSVTPGAVGTSRVTLTVTNPVSGASAATTIAVGVSGATPELSGVTYLTGASDASSAIAIDDDYMIVADDETNTLRLYSRTESGAPITTWNFNGVAGLTGEGDLEAAARIGNTIYWFGSHSNNKSSVYKPDRSVIFSTIVTGTGANTQLSYGTKYTGLRADLIAWDSASGDRLGLAAACSLAGGTHPDVSTGCNIEGVEFAPDNSTMYVGFRSPLANGKAVIVPIADFESLLTASDAPAGLAGTDSVSADSAVSFAAPAAVSPRFGEPILLDLGGRSIREIRKNDLGQYLITAGVPDDGDASLGWALFSWNGSADTQPTKILTLPSTTGADGQGSGSWESIVAVPDLRSASTVQLITDNGTTAFYGDGVAGKDISPAALQKARASWFALAALPEVPGTTPPTTPGTTTPGTTVPGSVPAGSVGATAATGSGQLATTGIGADGIAVAGLMAALLLGLGGLAAAVAFARRRRA